MPLGWMNPDRTSEAFAEFRAVFGPTDWLRDLIAQIDESLPALRRQLRELKKDDN